MSQYCAPSDVASLAIPAQAISQIANADQITCCIAASAMIDDYINSRGNLPLLTPFPQSLVMYAAWIAAFLMMKRRGYNPTAGADPLIVKGYADAIEWAKGVQRQSINPQLIFTPTSPPKFQLPQVNSGTPRGW